MRFVATLLAVAAIGLVLFAPTSINASEMAGIYALVERAIMEPNDQAPQRIQLWGVFASTRDVRNPKRGYMYFALPATQHETVRKEWADLKAIAGTGKVVAYGIQRFSTQGKESADNYQAGLGRVRSASEVLGSPDAYVINVGLQGVTNPTIVDILKNAPAAPKR